MPVTKHTVFYAWQSDTPSPVGRTFLERALERTLQRLKDDSTVEPADRPEAEVDRDTRGTPGSPPISATILAKIERCSVFVGDMTFVGQSLEGLRLGDNIRFFPNPNVQLEYGYALKARGTERIVAVMNTAYGPADPLPHLPFDLRHLRAPVRYHLPADASPEDRSKVLESLARELAGRIGPCLDAARAVTGESAPPAFIRAPLGDPTEYFSSVGQFLPLQKLPWNNQELQLVLPKKSSAYLRLSPVSAVPALESELVALRLMEEAQLRPMGTELTGFSHIRNGLGALAYTPSGNDVYNFTQLFLSRELMGVDLKLAHPAKAGGRSGIVLIETLERSFLAALISFTRFYRSSLNIALPWHLECGLSGVYDYCLSFESHVAGHILKAGLSTSATMDQDDPPLDILRPFFQSVWEAAGVERPKDRDTLLAQLAASFRP